MTSCYEFLHVKELKISGWLKRQLVIQANGLAGNLDKVWPDIRESSWIGGNREGWERVPYWLDGFIPLAYLLNDADLKARAQKYIEAIIANQQEDGWICPCTIEARPTYDMWALLLIGKVMTVYYECTQDDRIPGLLLKAYKQFLGHIKQYPLFDWGRFRWFEGMITVDFLKRFTDEPWLGELADLLKTQGYDYQGMFFDWHHTMPERRWTFETHVVNMGMVLKLQAVDAKAATNLAETMYETLQRDHGMACGHFTGDECLSGLSPIQGTELCGVAEAMYSYEILAAHLPDEKCKWADRLENLAFNAFPATTSTDMWTHQYDQQTNQIGCEREGKLLWGTNSGESNLFGLEPNYGCCTANMGQAWPKFAMSAWMRRGEDEICNLLPVPSAIETNVGGVKVQIGLESDYPFKGHLKYTVEAESPVTFTLSLRIPGSASKAVVDGKEVAPGTAVEIRKNWNGKSQIEVEMDFATKIVKREADMMCVWRGPLLFALPIASFACRIEYSYLGVERKFPYCDYELVPFGKWYYGFASTEFSAEEHDVPEAPFDTEHPAVTLKGTFIEIPWTLLDGYRGVATAQPAGRVPVQGAVPVELTMVPYACAKTRMTEMPLI